MKGGVERIRFFFLLFFLLHLYRQDDLDMVFFFTWCGRMESLGFV